MKIEVYSSGDGTVSAGPNGIKFPLDHVTSLRIEFSGGVMKGIAVIDRSTELELFRAEAGTDAAAQQKALQAVARLFGPDARGKLSFKP